ncbi:hypothetical protein ACFQET_08830 [Levilactobacillus tangyuanensis]|uniref:Phage head morphogenesis protein n=1 Tax=Levilactobacillus tangyuanensis TaxID=2486021 RepID=A0ABW1TPV2_9LACO|nr:hypothetical protein [Levilactobacillus tangyuanensis]
MAQLIKMDSQSDKQSEQYYDEFLSYIRDHLTAFYQHYADDNGLTLAQTMTRVSKWDLEQWKQALDSLGDTSDWPEEAQNRLKIQTYVASINRQQLIGSVLALGIIGLTVKNQRTIEKRVESDGVDEVSHLKKALKLAPKQVKKTTSVITQVSSRKQWSANLWVDSDKLAGDVQYLVNQNLKHGLSLDNLPRLLEKHVNPNQFKPGQSIADRVEQMSYETKRLVRTESARLKYETDLATYRMKGVKWVKWLTEPGACSKCQGIAAGGPYAIDDVPEIPGDSHPNCRCSIVPYVKSMDNQQKTVKQYGLTQDEQAGVLRWVSGDSYKLNSVLREGNEPTGLLKTTMDELDSALAKLPRYNGYIQRSVDLSGQQLNDFLWKFNSSSYSSKQYLSFTKNADKYNGTAAVQLFIKESKGGHNLGAFNEAEGEVLYERGAEFRVLDTFVDKDNKFIIELGDDGHE